MQDFIERLRAKPEHVRKQIAMGTAGALTGVVAVGWLTALVAGGTLALDAPQEEPAFDVLAQDSQNTFSQLAGALGAATSSEPELTVIESNTSSTLDDRNQEPDTRTVIPF